MYESSKFLYVDISTCLPNLISVSSECSDSSERGDSLKSSRLLQLLPCSLTREAMKQE